MRSTAQHELCREKCACNNLVVQVARKIRDGAHQTSQHNLGSSWHDTVRNDRNDFEAGTAKALKSLKQNRVLEVGELAPHP
jgi:hypothetical protein